MGKSVHDNHLEWVMKLKQRGEQVLQPKFDKPMGNIDGYVKSENPPKNAGAIFQDKEGKFGIFGDFGAIHITGIEWSDIGLCDARCWYEWADNRRENPKLTEETLKKLLLTVDEAIKEVDSLRADLIEIRNKYIKIK